MQFWDSEPAKAEFDYEVEKQKFIDNMDYLASMTVEEQTLYKKWVEWNADLPSSMKRKAAMAQYIDQLWSPTDIMNKEQTIQEIDALDPYVEIVADAKESTRWTEVRKLIHTMSFSANPGRNMGPALQSTISLSASDYIEFWCNANDASGSPVFKSNTIFSSTGAGNEFGGWSVA